MKNKKRLFIWLEEHLRDSGNLRIKGHWHQPSTLSVGLNWPSPCTHTGQHQRDNLLAATVLWTSVKSQDGAELGKKKTRDIAEPYSKFHQFAFPMQMQDTWENWSAGSGELLESEGNSREWKKPHVFSGPFPWTWVTELFIVARVKIEWPTEHTWSVVV